jgi:ribosome-associated toxin RatA of RatAB toxin-antitoxin module
MTKKFLTSTLAAFCLLCLIAGAARAQLTDQQMDRLKKGIVITQSLKDEASGDRVSSGFIMLPAPPELVWKVLTNYPAYPEFNSDIKVVKVDKKEGDKLWVEMNFRNFFSLQDFKVRAQVDENSAARAINLKMEQGDFEKYYLSWKLTVIDKDNLLAEYRLYKYVGWWWFPLVPNYLGNESQVRDTLNAFKKQVQMVRAQDSSNPDQLIKPIWRKSDLKDKPKTDTETPGEPGKETKPDEKGKLPNIQPEVHRPDNRY